MNEVGYYYLKEGEIIHEGDEYFATSDGWGDSSRAGERVGPTAAQKRLYRRPTNLINAVPGVVTTSRSHVINLEKPEKPAAEVMPEWLWIEKRIQELAAAIQRNPSRENLLTWSQELRHHAQYLASIEKPEPILENAKPPAAQNWLVIFHDREGYACDGWYWLQNVTEDEARKDATCDRRHMDYGRGGYSLIPCPTKPEPITE